MVYFSYFFDSMGQNVFSTPCEQWIKEDRNIQLGCMSDKEEIREKYKDHKIELSEIYSLALNLSETEKISLAYTNSLNGIESKKLIYPQLFILYLLRVLKESTQDFTKRSISNSVLYYERQLGFETKSQLLANGVQMIRNFSKDVFGIEIPLNMEIPPDEEFFERAKSLASSNKQIGVIANKMFNAVGDEKKQTELFETAKNIFNKNIDTKNPLDSIKDTLMELGEPDVEKSEDDITNNQDITE
jgi:hypothetical protein